MYDKRFPLRGALHAMLDELERRPAQPSAFSRWEKNRRDFLAATTKRANEILSLFRGGAR